MTRRYERRFKPPASAGMARPVWPAHSLLPKDAQDALVRAAESGAGRKRAVDGAINYVRDNWPSYFGPN